MPVPKIFFQSNSRVIKEDRFYDSCFDEDYDSSIDDPDFGDYLE
jgi:hypothetical protein